MKAVVLKEFGKPLSIEEIPEPVPDQGQVLIQVEASGVCHTDLHIVRDLFPKRRLGQNRWISPLEL